MRDLDLDLASKVVVKFRFQRNLENQNKPISFKRVRWSVEEVEFSSCVFEKVLNLHTPRCPVVKVAKRNL